MVGGAIEVDKMIGGRGRDRAMKIMKLEGERIQIKRDQERDKHAGREKKINQTPRLHLGKCRWSTAIHVRRFVAVRLCKVAYVSSFCALFLLGMT